MTRIYPGPTSLTALGGVGELDLLTYFDGELVVPEAVEREVTTEPARTGLATFLDERDVAREVPDAGYDRATDVLGVAADTHEAAVLGGVVAGAGGDRDRGVAPVSDGDGDAAARDEDGDVANGDEARVAVVSEDRRLRRLAEGLGGSVTSAFGVVVRAAIEDKYFSRSQAKRVVRRVDDRGLGMTGAVREQAVGALGE
ncbi:MAG: hypothetical protein V5A44_12800 [Haloarculaceae archaeon]